MVFVSILISNIIHEYRRGRVLKQAESERGFKLSDSNYVYLISLISLTLHGSIRRYSTVSIPVAYLLMSIFVTFVPILMNSGVGFLSTLFGLYLLFDLLREKYVSITTTHLEIRNRLGVGQRLAWQDIRLIGFSWGKKGNVYEFKLFCEDAKQHAAEHVIRVGSFQNVVQLRLCFAEAIRKGNPKLSISSLALDQVAPGTQLPENYDFGIFTR